MNVHEQGSDLAHPSAHPAAGRRRRTAGALIVVLLLAGLVAVAPTVAARPSAPTSSEAVALPPTTDPPEPTEPPETTTRPPITRPPVPPVPNPECDDAAGFARPTGTIPPGYVYTPTKFDGTVKDPQPDDTFVSDAVPRSVHTGKLRTRIVGGTEQVLVCAHVGTNTPTDVLTPFPTTGTGAHRATIAPRVVLIDSVGTAKPYDFGAADTDSTMHHYAGSTDVHEGYAQMWVPLGANLREPGFVVRVEIRGTSALWGQSAVVMGADEVFVHVGPQPTSAAASVSQAVGAAVDASAIGERPTDPGPDDLAAVLEPKLKPLISSRIRAFAPQDLELDVDGQLWGWSNITFGSARLDSLGNTVRSAKVDVENFNATEGRGVIDIDATLFPSLTVSPRSIGLVSITGGSCRASATVDVHIRAGFEVDLSADRTKPQLKILFVTTSGTVQSVSVTGRLDVYWLGSISCSRIESDIRDGIDDGMAERLDGLRDDLALRADVEKQVGEMLTPADVSRAPISGAEVALPNGVGFTLNSVRYLPTAPAGHLAGDVFISKDGANLAVSANVDDQGSSRFPYSYVPSQTSDLLSNLRGRTRPGSGGSFDVGLVVSGATVNQLGRALTAGDVRPLISPPTQGVAKTVADDISALDDTVEVGLLDLATNVSGLTVTVHPAVAPMYLPTPPASWPASVRSDLNLYVPSLRLGTTIEGVATMATDVRLGMTAEIDGTNHLVPIARASKVDVAPRFLRLGAATNLLIDPAIDRGNILALATTAVKANVPSAVGAVIEPIQIPDLSVGTVHVHLERLTVGTVGGGHLGAFVDVEPGAAASGGVPLQTSWTAGPAGQPPATLTATVLPAAIPLPDDTEHPATVAWTVTDANAPDGTAPLYPPPGGATSPEPFTKTFDVSGITGTTPDPCTGERDVVAKVSARVTKDGVTRTSSVYAVTSFGTPPDRVPSICNHDEDDPPTTEPEPTIPPMCNTKPWLCDDL